MDFLSYLTLLVLFLLVCKHLIKSTQKPPSPFAIPIIGHLHLLKKPLHRTLQTLSDRYGPVLLLRFGLRNVLVLSSPSAIEESFTTNDTIFANRPSCFAGQHLGYNYTTLAWAPYGPHWRTLRRLASTEIFSSNRLLISSGFRNDETKCLIKRLFVGSGFQKLELKSTFLELMFNVAMRIAAGKRCFEAEMDAVERKRLLEFLRETFVPNMSMGLGDFFPPLAWFGFLGLDKKFVKLQKTRDNFLRSLIEERRLTNATNLEDQTRAVADTLLSLQRTEPEFHTDDLIKGVISMMFTAGTDTSALTMEWAMALLLNHPEAMKKARAEIESQVQHGGLVEDSDLAKLPYLNCIVNETMRLYPAGPLLVPHASSGECTVGGYRIPAGTIVLGNAWAIHRDPKVWAEPTAFKPERFESVVGERVEGLKFIPFGVGRRGCPGAALGMRTVALVLGALLQCFEWERVGGEAVDMSERPGTTMPKLQPLEALYRPRHTKISLLSQL